MPNVMGREFQYTPQGMADADQYRRSLGMRDGGPMGFRPLGYAGGGHMSSRPAGYANGDLVESNRDTAAMLQEALTNLSPDDLRMFIENNEGALRALAQSNPAVAAQIQAAMDSSGFTAQRAADMKDTQGLDNTGRFFTGAMADPNRPMQNPPMGMQDFPGYTPPAQPGGMSDYFPPMPDAPLPPAPVGPRVDMIPRPPSGMQYAPGNAASPSGIMTLGRL